MRNKLSTIFLASCILSCFVSCNKKIKESQQLIESFTVNFEDNTFFTGFRMIDNSRQNNYISRLSNDIAFGGGMFFKIPDSLINKSIKVIVKCKLRTSGMNTYGHLLAFTLNSNEKQLQWMQMDMDPHIKKRNDWNEMTDSTFFPSFRNKLPGAEIRVFGFNASKKSFMDYDDLQVSFYKVEP